MQFRPEWQGLVPPAGDLDLLPDIRSREALTRAQRAAESRGLSPGLDSLYWLYRLAGATEQLNELAAITPWLDRMAVGFIDRETDGVEDAFGIICYSNVPETARTVDPVRFNGERRGIDLGYWFPAVIRAGSQVPQVSVTSPSLATVTTWSKSKRARVGGWLVPAHAVDLNSEVKFSNGSIGRVTDNWGKCIDVVLVTPNVGPTPRALIRRHCFRGWGAGTRVCVTDRLGTFHDAHVLDVDVNLGVVQHHLFPVRFSYSWESSLPGDSGALVASMDGDMPIGMHQGKFKWRTVEGHESQHAYALCLFQLEDYGGLEVYQ